MSDGIREQLQSALGGAYTIERELGGGGMSRVFLAQETALARAVVVKVLTPELAAGVSAERFAREVKLAARLQQANIVPVLSTGDANGLPWYAMPFVRGESLRARLALGTPVPIVDAVHVLRDVARALAYAHGEGIVHRDIKPDNILLSGGAAVVADFGIAKAVSSSLTQDGAAAGTLTQVGTAIGTPAYMAPEQSAGDPTTDHRADIYAWGIVAWELLGGKHPFAGRTTPQAMLAAHMTEVPAPLGKIRADLPAPLAALVARTLLKDPTQRPASASELLATLDRMATPAPVMRGVILRSNVRWPVIAAVVALLAVAAWAAVRARGVAAAPSAVPADKSLAVLPFESVGGDTANAYFAEGMADELTSALAKVPGLQLAGRSSSNAFRGKHPTAQEVGRVLGVGAVLEGTVRRAGSRMRVSAQLTNAGNGRMLWTETYEREVKDVFAVQDDISRAIANALRVKLGAGTSVASGAATRGTTNLEAYDLYLRGMYFYQRRGTAIAKAIENFQGAIAKDPAFARAHAGLGLAWTTLAIYSNTPVSDVLPKALAEAGRALELDSSSAEAYVALGMAHTYAWRWGASDTAFRRAIALDANLAIAHQWYSRMLLATGRVSEAVTEIQLAKALDPLNAAAVATEALTLSMAGRDAEAVAAGRRGVELDSSQNATQSYLIVALMNAGMAAEARARAERVLTTSTDLPVLGACAYAIGRGGDAVGATILADRIGRGHGSESRVHSALLRAAFGIGDTARALAELERVVDGSEVGIVNHPLIDRMYDPVRQSPRLLAVVRRLGLDERVFTSRTHARQ